MVPLPDPCVNCGAAGAEIADGYCGTCGHKEPDPRDHVEIDLGSVALVSDKGKRHHLNEDAMAATVTAAGLVVVVCDGVSSTVAPEAASQAAAEAAAASLAASLHEGADAAVAMTAATAAAQLAVVETPPTRGEGDPASCTFVGCSIPTGGFDGQNLPVTIGWLGDSRAYLVSNGNVTQLTSDDSWANQQVETGVLTAEEAEGDPRAHSITRWLGQDAIDVVPRTAETTATDGDLIIVCSDGLWNYAPTEAELADVIEGLRADRGPVATPLRLAQQLVTFALDAGGHDNVTVAVASPTTASLATASPKSRTQP